MKRSLPLFAILALLAGTVVLAQRPFFGGPGRRGGGDVVTSSVARMMEFDADQDGKLTRSEVADARLEPLLERADADNDGTVTNDELTALFTRESSSSRPERGDGPPRERNGSGFGPPPGAPPGRPRPGEVLPRFMQDELQLTRRQRRQLEALQADVDERLAKILTDEQRATLDDLRSRGFGGPPPGGPPRDGGPPPDGPSDDAAPRRPRQPR